MQRLGDCCRLPSSLSDLTVRTGCQKQNRLPIGKETHLNRSNVRIDAHHHAIPERVLHLLRHDPAYRVTIEGDLFLGGNWGNFRLVPSWVDPTAKLAHLESKGLTGAVVSAAPKPPRQPCRGLFSLCRRPSAPLADQPP